MFVRLTKALVLIRILLFYTSRRGSRRTTVKVYFKTFLEYSSWLWLFALCESEGLRVSLCFLKVKCDVNLPNRFSREAIGIRTFFGFDTGLWENKVLMHKSFDLHGVPTPNTEFISAKDQKINIKGVKIIKGNMSSGSREVLKFSNTVLDTNSLDWTSPVLLIQDYVDFRSDYRVIVASKQVHSVLQRNNNSQSWIPTSNNAKCSFEWVTKLDRFDSLVEFTTRLQLPFAAWDVCFDNNDNLRILEVSPLFMPRPKGMNPNGTRSLVRSINYEICRYKEIIKVVGNEKK